MQFFFLYLISEWLAHCWISDCLLRMCMASFCHPFVPWQMTCVTNPHHHTQQLPRLRSFCKTFSLLELSPDPVIHRLTWFPEGLEQPFNYAALTFGLMVNVQTSAKFLGDVVIVCGIEFILVGLSSLLPSFHSSAEHHSGSCCSAKNL